MTAEAEQPSLNCVVAIPPLDAIKEFVQNDVADGVPEGNAEVMAYASRYLSLWVETADAGTLQIGGPWFEELDSDWSHVKIGAGDREAACAAAAEALEDLGERFFAGRLDASIDWMDAASRMQERLGKPAVELKDLPRRTTADGDLVEVMLPGAPEWAIERPTPGLPRHGMTIGEWMKRHPDGHAGFFDR